MYLLAILALALFASPAYAATYYLDNLVACTGNYNISTRACDGADGNSYTTMTAAIAPLAPGDTLYIRPFSGGTGNWNAQIDLQGPNKTGTVGNPITIAGYPGETVTFQYVNPTTLSYGTTKARGSRGYITFRNMVWDGTDLGSQTQGISMRDGNHHFILDGIEIRNHDATAIGINGSDNLITRCNLHDNFSSSDVSGNRHYGVYVSGGANNVIEFNRIYRNSGGGIQLYNGTSVAALTNTIVRYNRVYENNTMTSSQVAGITVSGGSTIKVIGAKIHDNVVYRNGKWTPAGGGSDGINIIGDATNTEIYNNTVFDNQRRGIGSGGDETGTIVRNNISIGNDVDDYLLSSSGFIASHNACTGVESCGSSKVTISSIGDCVVDSATDDYRLKQGTNVCRNAGTSVTTRPTPVGVTDLGAYEQGAVTSASVVSGFIELVTSVMTPGVSPSTGITAVTITCVSCTGSPVASTVNVKSASNNILQVSVSGITGNGTCTISIGNTNAKDSLMIGGPLGTAQGINSVTALSVSGTCQNTTAGGGGVVATWSHFSLDEGSGTTANDDTGEAHHGTVSAGVTWVNNASGTGVSIPTDATYRHVSSTYGAGINPSSQDFAVCARVKFDSVASQKVVISAGGNGTNQRWYGGIAIVGGQPQWGMGIQASGFASTGSEFVATTNLTFVCMVNDSAADTTTLWIDGVKGTQTGKSVKSLTSFTLVGNLRVGNDGTFTSNNGGYTVYDIWVWDTKPAESDIPNLYASFTPTSTTACLAQSHRQFEHVYTTSVFAPVPITPKGDGSIDVVANGGVAVRIQYTCTGTAGSTVAMRLNYSLNGTDFFLPIPQTLGVEGISMWGSDIHPRYNDGASSGCLDATGLTANSGVTIFDAVASPTFTLAQDHCRSDRYIIRVGNIPGESRWLRVQTDAGDTFANGYSQAIKINVIDARAVGGF